MHRQTCECVRARVCECVRARVCVGADVGEGVCVRVCGERVCPRA